MTKREVSLRPRSEDRVGVAVKDSWKGTGGRRRREEKAG